MKSQEDSCYVNSNTTWNLSAWEKELSKISVTEKIKQRKVKGRSKDQSEDFRYNKQHSWLSPVYIGQAQVEEKTYKRGSQSTFSLSFSPTCVCSFSLSPSLTLSLYLPRTLLHSLLFQSLGWHALTLRGWILLLSSK